MKVFRFLFSLIASVMALLLLRMCIVYKLGELIAFMFGAGWVLVLICVYLYCGKIVDRCKRKHNIVGNQ